MSSVLFSEDFGCESVDNNDIYFACFGRNFHGAVFAHLKYWADTVNGISRHFLIFADVLYHDFTGHSTDFNAVGANVENPGSADIYSARGEDCIAETGSNLNLCCSGVMSCHLAGGAYGSYIFGGRRPDELCAKDGGNFHFGFSCAVNGVRCRQFSRGANFQCQFRRCDSQAELLDCVGSKFIG